MAPLVTQESCLICHEKQGYQVGDIRGGISITFDTNPVQIWPIITSHIFIATVGFGVILVFTTQLGKAFDQLEVQSSLDGLTQINNRRYFDTYFNREFLRSRRTRVPLSIIICDVDFFKPYNDLYGHQAGDEVLKKIAAALDDTLKRPGDIVARYGGEEFAIVLPDTSHDGAYVIAEMLRATIEMLEIPYQQNQTSKRITISLGLWTFNGGESSQEDVLEKADKALYQAKKKGRNMVCSYEDI
jgi:diguanylate cyclase (GGDEF)-like protein